MNVGSLNQFVNAPKKIPKTAVIQTFWISFLRSGNLITMQLTRWVRIPLWQRLSFQPKGLHRSDYLSWENSNKPERMLLMEQTLKYFL